MVKIIEDEKYKKLENVAMIFFGFLFGIIGVLLRSQISTELSISLLAFLLGILIATEPRTGE